MIEKCGTGAGLIAIHMAFGEEALIAPPDVNHGPVDGGCRLHEGGEYLGAHTTARDDEVVTTGGRQHLGNRLCERADEM